MSELRAIQVKPVQAQRLISSAMRSRLVAVLHGSPGIGKSDIGRAIARKFNLKLIDFRLAQCDPTDLLGFPTIVGGRADYLPMVTFPIEGDPLPINEETGQPYDGWLLFFDEITSALPAIQAAAYKVVLDRMVGQHRLHECVAMIAAGNLEGDNAIVQPMSTALQSRLVHLELICDVGEWIDWAQKKGLDHKVTDFIQFAPKHLYSFDPDHTDKTYACPRTWEFANRHLVDLTAQGPEALKEDLLPLLAGTLGEGIALEFNVFLDIYKDLPKIDAILANPTQIMVPTAPSVLYALTGTIAHHTTLDNVETMLQYVSRLAPEFQVTCLKDAKKRNERLVKHPAVQKWAVNNGKAFFS